MHAKPITPTSQPDRLCQSPGYVPWLFMTSEQKPWLALAPGEGAAVGRSGEGAEGLGLGPEN